jgi:hypothetical protein
LLSKITVRVLEGTTSDWLFGLAAAQAFHAEHGHLRVPYQDASGDTYLSIWARNARAAFQLNQLAPDRVTALDELGMEWFPHQADWERGFTAAQTFYREHGHLRAPAGLRINGVNLNAWLNSRRLNHRAGKLSADRLKALTDLCSDWFIARGDWEQALAAARKFHAQHGHLRVTKGQCIDGINVGNWLIRQRFLHRRGELATERVAALNALNIDWNPPVGSQAGWQQRFEAAVSFYQREGHLRVPSEHRENGVALYSWLRYQGERVQRGTVTAAQSDALKSIGFDGAGTWGLGRHQ